MRAGSFVVVGAALPVPGAYNRRLGAYYRQLVVARAHPNSNIQVALDQELLLLEEQEGWSCKPPTQPRPWWHLLGQAALLVPLFLAAAMLPPRSRMYDPTALARGQPAIAQPAESLSHRAARRTQELVINPVSGKAQEWMHSTGEWTQRSVGSAKHRIAHTFQMGDLSAAEQQRAFKIVATVSSVVIGLVVLRMSMHDSEFAIDITRDSDDWDDSMDEGDQAARSLARAKAAAAVNLRNAKLATDRTQQAAAAAAAATASIGAVVMDAEVAAGKRAATGEYLDQTAGSGSGSSDPETVAQLSAAADRISLLAEDAITGSGAQLSADVPSVPHPPNGGSPAEFATALPASSAEACMQEDDDETAMLGTPTPVMLASDAASPIAEELSSAEPLASLAEDKEDAAYGNTSSTDQVQSMRGMTAAAGSALDMDSSVTSTDQVKSVRGMTTPAGTAGTAAQQEAEPARGFFRSTTLRFPWMATLTEKPDRDAGVYAAEARAAAAAAAAEKLASSGPANSLASDEEDDNEEAAFSLGASSADPLRDSTEEEEPPQQAQQRWGPLARAKTMRFPWSAALAEKPDRSAGLTAAEAREAAAEADFAKAATVSAIERQAAAAAQKLSSAQAAQGSTPFAAQASAEVTAMLPSEEVQAEAEPAFSAVVEATEAGSAQGISATDLRTEPPAAGPEASRQQAQSPQRQGFLSRAKTMRFPWSATLAEKPDREARARLPSSDEPDSAAGNSGMGAVVGEAIAEVVEEKGKASPLLMMLGMASAVLQPFGLSWQAKPARGAGRQATVSSQGAGRTLTVSTRPAPPAKRPRVRKPAVKARRALTAEEVEASKDWTRYQKYDLFHQLLQRSAAAPAYQAAEWDPVQGLVRSIPPSGVQKYDALRHLLRAMIRPATGHSKYDMVWDLLRGAQAFDARLGYSKYDPIYALLNALTLEADWSGVDDPLQDLFQWGRDSDDWGVSKYDPVAALFEAVNTHTGFPPSKYDPLPGIWTSNAPSSRPKFDPLQAAFRAEAPSGRAGFDPLGALFEYVGSKGAPLRRAGPADDAEEGPAGYAAEAEHAQQAPHDPLVNFLGSVEPPTGQRSGWDPLAGLFSVKPHSHATARPAYDPVGRILHADPPTGVRASLDPLTGLFAAEPHLHRSAGDPIGDLLRADPPTGTRAALDPLSAAFRLQPHTSHAAYADPLDRIWSAEAPRGRAGFDPLAAVLAAEPPRGSGWLDPLPDMFRRMFWAGKRAQQAQQELAVAGSGQQQEILDLERQQAEAQERIDVLKREQRAEIERMLQQRRHDQLAAWQQQQQQALRELGALGDATAQRPSSVQDSSPLAQMAAASGAATKPQQRPSSGAAGGWKRESDAAGGAAGAQRGSEGSAAAYDPVPDLLRLQGGLSSLDLECDPAAVIVRRNGASGSFQVIAAEFRQLAGDTALEAAYPAIFALMHSCEADHLMWTDGSVRLDLSQPELTPLQCVDRAQLASAATAVAGLVQDIRAPYPELHGLLEAREAETAVHALCALAAVLPVVSTAEVMEYAAASSQ
ncbi:hypothetical protein WJX72_012378 [[Myrmecia] bisecta]|uniref:Uncharacterized protein n=1 Tax=[Myrmecia] bisecta TaxID=41462 RepID=A0AAW1Q262_9CHLO